jgi:hypothetical protein
VRCGRSDYLGDSLICNLAHIEPWNSLTASCGQDRRSGNAAPSRKGSEVLNESNALADSSILVVDLGDIVTLTAGGEEDSTEDKRNPYD